jgi:hypothetical protein
VTTVILMTLFISFQIDERSKFQTQKGLIFGLVWDDGGFGAGVNFHHWSNF